MGTAVDLRSSDTIEAVPSGNGQAPELSVVIPCLNEMETLGRCIEKVQETFRKHRIAGEVVVADNGSTDGSRDVAARMGARVVRVHEKGYGNALRGGAAAARGKYIIMGDADGSHDFAQIPLFLWKLREGFDLVMGNRFKGGIKPGAMPIAPLCWQSAVDPDRAALFPKPLRRPTLRVSRLHQRRLPKDGLAGRRHGISQ